MTRNELLHRMAEQETVTIADVDNCIREEKQRIIENVCKWINNELVETLDSFGYQYICSSTYVNKESLIKNLRKAMEE